MVLTYVCTLVFPVSCLSTYCKAKEGVVSNACLYLGFLSVMSVYLSQGEKGWVLTYVSTWLSLCHVFPLLVKRKRGGFDLFLYVAFSVMSFYLSQGINGPVLTYVCTCLSLRHVFLLLAR